MNYPRISMHLNVFRLFGLRLAGRMRMRCLPALSLLLVCLLWLSPLHAAGDFGLIDHRGDFHQISRYANSPAVIILPYQIGDAASEQSVLSLQLLSAQMQTDWVRFLSLTRQISALSSAVH
jgi:hypothetical protein